MTAALDFRENAHRPCRDHRALSLLDSGLRRNDDESPGKEEDNQDALTAALSLRSQKAVNVREVSFEDDSWCT